MALVVKPTDLLLIVDVQPDFCSGGALAVARGEEVIAPINRMTDRFAHVAATQDWHPADHVSFACNHPRKRPYEMIELPYGAQTLWPRHCVQGTEGAMLHPQLRQDSFEFILRKGFHRYVDSYSAFVENDQVTSTGLAGYLRERGFDRIVLAGLALDYCVNFSARDARMLGFDVVVVTDACRAIGSVRSLDAVLEALHGLGVTFVTSDDVRGATQ